MSNSVSTATRMRSRIIATIRKIPGGKVSTYGSIARAAGYPGYARQVAYVLHHSIGLPWHRVLGAGGEIKVPREYAFDQRFRLQSEGVSFRGKRVNMAEHEFHFGGARKKSSRRAV